MYDKSSLSRLRQNLLWRKVKIDFSSLFFFSFQRSLQSVPRSLQSLNISDTSPTHTSVDEANENKIISVLGMLGTGGRDHGVDQLWELGRRIALEIEKRISFFFSRRKTKKCLSFIESFSLHFRGAAKGTCGRIKLKTKINRTFKKLCIFFFHPGLI